VRLGGTRTLRVALFLRGFPRHPTCPF
jgi:hypothetical protein